MRRRAGNAGEAQGQRLTGLVTRERAGPRRERSRELRERAGPQADQGASIEQGATASAAADQGDVGNTHVTCGGRAGEREPGRAGEPSRGAGGCGDVRDRGDARRGVDHAGRPRRLERDAVGRRQHGGRSAGGEPRRRRRGLADERRGGRGDARETSGAQEAAEASATQSGVDNSSVSVRVFSPGDDGPSHSSTRHRRSGRRRAGGAEDATPPGRRPQHERVDRVESSGTTGPVSQSNSVTENAVVAEQRAEIAVGVTDERLDTVVAVVVDGDGLERSGVAGLEVWEWTWVWQRDECESLEAWLGTTVDSWTWTWDGTGHGTVTTRAAGDDDGDRAGGSWAWSWEWDRQGMAGWSWQWEWNATLACGTCIWIWNWSWGWTGEPTESSAQAAGNGDVGTGPRAGQHGARRGRGDGSRGSRSGRLAGRLRKGHAVRRPADRGGPDGGGKRNGRPVRRRRVSWGDAMSQANVVTSEAAATLETTVARTSSRFCSRATSRQPTSGAASRSRSFRSDTRRPRHRSATSCSPDRASTVRSGTPSPTAPRTWSRFPRRRGSPTAARSRSRRPARARRADR